MVGYKIMLKTSGPKGCGLLTNIIISFEKVAYVDGLKHNLLNISQLYDKGFLVFFKKD